MRFLLDESADTRLANFLRDNGHEETSIGVNYPAGLSDPEVLAIALSKRRTLIANDLDFGELVVHRGYEHSGVILLRLPGKPLTK